MVVGAQQLDFRTNTSFRNPSQYGRGFAIFPEVSTFATHLIYLLGIMLVVRRFRILQRLLKLRKAGLWLLLALTCLAISRSSSVIVIAPIIVAVAYMKGRKLSLSELIGVLAMVGVTMLLLQIYITNFYLDRAQGSAFRSMWLRGITILTGLSVIPNGEIFGVGLGNNGAVTTRAFEVARSLNFSFILLPTGINSFVVARIFEEGWLALIMFGFAFVMLMQVVFRRQSDPALMCLTILALASFLVSLLVTGYRGIYMNWFWLGAAPALSSQLLVHSRRKHHVLPRGVLSDQTTSDQS
jgi:hypothetical protein